MTLKRPEDFAPSASLEIPVPASEVALCEAVLLLGHLHRVGLLPLDVELLLQRGDLLAEFFDLGIARRRGVELPGLLLHGAVCLGSPAHGILGRRLRLRVAKLFIEQ